jgi:alkylation response protein AidB-like acyl-CoA dehydrogenase
MKLFEQLSRRRDWPEDERLVLDQVRRVVNEVIAPNAARYDESGEYPRESVAALMALGLNGIFIPAEYGGTPMSFALYLECVKIIASGCASTGVIYATNFNGVKPIVDFGNEEQKKRLLPRITEGGIGAIAITEQTAGSDATGMQTRFTPDGEYIVVNGSKTFISNGSIAELVLLFGKWSEIDDRKAAISALVLEKDTPGFSVLRNERKMGHRAAPTVSLAFDNCRVPRANLIGAPGTGLATLLVALNKSRPSMAAHALGIARAAFDDIVSYTNERKQSGQSIIDFQGNQFLLADLASELAMTELWLDYVADLVDSGAAEFGLEASIAKLRASDLAMRMATDAVQMHGANGYSSEYRVERLMRDAKVTQIWEGTNQIHRQFIGRSFKIR